MGLKLAVEFDGLIPPPTPPELQKLLLPSPNSKLGVETDDVKLLFPPPSPPPKEASPDRNMLVRATLRRLGRADGEQPEL